MSLALLSGVMGLEHYASVLRGLKYSKSYFTRLSSENRVNNNHAIPFELASAFAKKAK